MQVLASGAELAATGELGEFAGASELRCSLFCDPGALGVGTAALPAAALQWTRLSDQEVELNKEY